MCKKQQVSGWPEVREEWQRFFHPLNTRRAQRGTDSDLQPNGSRRRRRRRPELENHDDEFFGLLASFGMNQSLGEPIVFYSLAHRRD